MILWNWFRTIKFCVCLLFKWVVQADGVRSITILFGFQKPLEGMNGTTALRHSVGGGGIAERVATLVVYKDDAGYGMKVSGDKPVYVQSVKEGKY